MICKIIFALATLVCASSAVRNPILVDLSYTVNNRSIMHPSEPDTFHFTRQVKVDSPFYLAHNSFAMAEHTSTHMDSMSHFIKNGTSVSDMRLNDFFLNGIVIDVSNKVQAQPDYLVQADDIKFTRTELAFMKRHRNLLLVRTGRGQYWNDTDKYLGVETVNGTVRYNFPGFGADGARKIVELGVFKAVGLDCVSLDGSATTNVIAHQTILGANIYGFENVARLDLIPVHEFFKVYAFPMNIDQGTGAPIRLVAEFKPRLLGKSPFKYRSWLKDH